MSLPTKHILNQIKGHKYIDRVMLSMKIILFSLLIPKHTVLEAKNMFGAHITSIAIKTLVLYSIVYSSSVSEIFWSDIANRFLFRTAACALPHEFLFGVQGNWGTQAFLRFFRLSILPVSEVHSGWEIVLVFPVPLWCVQAAPQTDPALRGFLVCHVWSHHIQGVHSKKPGKLISIFQAVITGHEPVHFIFTNCKNLRSHQTTITI